MAVLTDNLPTIKVERVNIESYTVMDMTIMKQLLSPSEMRIRLRKKNLIRDGRDAEFDIAANLIGKQITASIATSSSDEEMKNRKESVAFSGIIFGADNVRETMGKTSYIDVVAYSPDYMLKDSPHCESFEEQTLAQIVKSVLDQSNGLLNSIEDDIDPMMKAEIPYVVQYNETSYDFLARLARRYGEWLFFAILNFLD